MVFAVGVTTCTAILFGLWPAWRLSRVNLQDALREAGRGMAGSLAAARMRSALVVAQCALAILLLAGAGLLLRSLGALRGMDARLSHQQRVDDANQRVADRNTRRDHSSFSSTISC